MESLTQNIERLNALLRTERFGRPCRWFDAVDSTNSLALAWAKEGAPTGALVAADYQEAGRGRFKRSWTAEPGRNLTFSLVLDAATADFGLLPIALAVAVTETLAHAVAPHRPLIKWPNDVMLAQRKVCGILIESSLPSHGPRTRAAIVGGIGINVNQEKFPQEIEDAATSIFQVLGRPTDRVTLLGDILLAVETTLDELTARDAASVLARYEALMVGLGKTVGFSPPEGGHPTEGTVLGIDGAGGLKVRTSDGTKILRAAEVTFRAPRSPGQTPQAARPGTTSSS